jgi:hypothetical protein
MQPIDLAAFLLMPTMAVIVGILSGNAAGRRYSRPPALLLAATLGVSVALFAGFCGMFERFVPGSFASAADARNLE